MARKYRNMIAVTEETSDAITQLQEKMPSIYQTEFGGITLERKSHLTKGEIVAVSVALLSKKVESDDQRKSQG